MNKTMVLAGAREFWKRYGINADFSGIVIPDRIYGFNRPLIIPKGLSNNHAVALCRTKFPVRTCADDLNKMFNRHDRTTAESYAVLVRDRAEADEEELKDLSLDDFIERGIKGITLVERLVFEMVFYEDGRGHLDVRNITLCYGSTNSYGDIPSVSWINGEFCINWSRPNSAGGIFRGRAVIA